jgi:hypothetical protein
MSNGGGSSAAFVPVHGCDCPSYVGSDVVKMIARSPNRIKTPFRQKIFLPGVARICMQLHATVDTRNLSPKNMCEVCRPHCLYVVQKSEYERQSLRASDGEPFVMKAASSIPGFLMNFLRAGAHQFRPSGNSSKTLPFLYRFGPQLCQRRSIRANWCQFVSPFRVPAA